MRILSKLMISSFALSLPLAVVACGDDTETGGMGGEGGMDGTGGSGATGGTGGNGGGGAPAADCPTDVPFEIADCLEAAGPNACVTGLTDGGAFVDGNWLAGWTNFSTDETPEDDGTVTQTETVDADITTDTTWSEDTVYELTAQVHVADGVTLTIEPGTLIKGSTNGSLIVSRGGKLMAEGTAAKPIVFTSSAANGSKARDQWGGVIILGKAKNWNGEALIEGLPDEEINKHGGDDDADNSGSLKYVRIEFGGTEISSGNEINGLTLGSVGSGTTLSYVQVNTTQDDGIEWFGGTVDGDHLVVNNAGDDMFDGDVGFRGTLSYLFGRHVAPISGDPNGFEMDGDNEAAQTVAVNTSIDTENTTLCGTGQPVLSGASWGAVFRENLEGSHTSMVNVGFDAAFDLRNKVNVTISDSWVWGQPIGEEGEEDDDNGVVEADWFTDGTDNTFVE